MIRKRFLSLNEDYFAIENLNINPVYHLGLMLLTDGWIYKEKNDKCQPVIGINLKKNRSELKAIVQYKKDIGSEHKIFECSHYDKRYDKTNYSYMLKFRSLKMAEDLEKIGIYPKKSLTMGDETLIIIDQWEKEGKIQKGSRASLMRGVNDGDGGFCLSSERKDRNETRYLRFKVRGTVKFLGTFQRLLGENIEGFEFKNKIQFESGQGSLEYNGNNIVFAIANYFYSPEALGPSPRFLERKYDLIKHFLPHNQPKSSFLTFRKYQTKNLILI